MEEIQRQMDGKDGVGWKQIRQMRRNKLKGMEWDRVGQIGKRDDGTGWDGKL